jgi:ribose/xylose/arabinose/galactoside ABC-type transport system permease subunit
VLRYTRYGRQVYAVGGNREAARLASVTAVPPAAK